MSSGVGEEDSSEKGLLEKAAKDHQMMRNARIQSLETLFINFL